MKKLKQCVLILTFVLLMFMFIGTVNAATEYEEGLIYKIAPDGKNAVFKMHKPVDEGDFYIVMENVLNYILNEEEYIATAYATSEELNNCDIDISNSITGELVGTYNVDVTYDEPEKNETIESILNKMKLPQDLYDLKNYYCVSDLNLINLYMLGESWSNNLANNLKFSKEFIEISEGSNLSFYLIARAGGPGEMFSYSAGDLSVFYDGYCYTNLMTGIYLQRVIYIPQNTAETSEAYIKAAQKRINDYLGTKDEVVVTYGGSLDELWENPEDLVDRDTTDGNYYNVTIGEETYKFYIMKGSREKLEKPKYRGKHIKSNIKITTDDATVPLDTELNIKVVEDKELEKALKTKNYKAYDIKLYSLGKEAAITKLASGKFLVSIPIPNNLKNKALTIYFVDSNGKAYEYKENSRDDKNNIITFETDHFSTYAVAEQAKDVTPGTGVKSNIEIATIASLVSFVSYVILIHKKQEQN